MNQIKGQVSFEIMVSVIVLLIFLIIVLTNNSFVNTQRELIDSSFKEKNNCLELMFTISNVYYEGSGTKIELYSQNDFEIFSEQKIVRVGEQDCRFIAKTNNYSLSKGNIKIENVNGVVEIEQI